MVLHAKLSPPLSTNDEPTVDSWFNEMPYLAMVRKAKSTFWPVFADVSVNLALNSRANFTPLFRPIFLSDSATSHLLPVSKTF